MDFRVVESRFSVPGGPQHVKAKVKSREAMRECWWLAVPVLLVAVLIAPLLVSPPPKMDMDVRCPTTPELFAAELGVYIAEASAAAVAERGVFVVALSGGSLPQAVAGALGAAATNSSAPPIDFSKWLVVYADERIVPLDHADSNHRACGTALAAFPIAASQFLAIDPALEPAECAREYEARIRAALRSPDPAATPVLDLVLLGMGPDGHTASLFPGASGRSNPTHRLEDSVALPL